MTDETTRDLAAYAFKLTCALAAGLLIGLGTGSVVLGSAVASTLVCWCK